MAQDRNSRAGRQGTGHNSLKGCDQMVSCVEDGLAAQNLQVSKTPEGKKHSVSPDFTLAHMTQLIMPQHANSLGITFGGQVCFTLLVQGWGEGRFKPFVWLPCQSVLHTVLSLSLRWCCCPGPSLVLRVSSC